MLLCIQCARFTNANSSQFNTFHYSSHEPLRHELLLELLPLPPHLLFQFDKQFFKPRNVCQIKFGKWDQKYLVQSMQFIDFVLQHICASVSVLSIPFNFYILEKRNVNEKIHHQIILFIIIKTIRFGEKGDNRQIRKSTKPELVFFFFFFLSHMESILY